MHATIRPAAAFALCSVVALSAGCGGAPTGARDGLRLELSVDRAAIAVGDSGTLTMRLHSDADRAIVLHFGSSCQILPYIETLTGVAQYPDGGDWGCAAVITSLEIPARGFVTRTLVVRGVSTGDGLSRASLPPGAYHAYARLGRGPSDPFIQSRVATFEVR